MELVKNINEATCITHSGTMHADEIFSTAFLDLFLEDIKVCRTTNVPENINENILVYDIGRGKYDHHQDGAKKRDNGITYCAFGLLWNEYGRNYLEKKKISNIEEVFFAFDKDFVEAIDADDNGIFPKIEASYKVKTLSDVFKLFNPGYKSGQDENLQFIKAVNVAKIIFEEELNNVIGKVIAKSQVEKSIALKENHTLYLNEYMPYEQTLLSTENANDIYFVVYPSNRGGYAIKTVPKSVEDHTKRVDFPETWSGLDNEELENVSGIKGIRFCHLTRFLVCCDTLETVKAIIDKVLSEKASEQEDNLDKKV